MIGTVTAETGVSSIDCELRVFDNAGPLVTVALSDENGTFSVPGLPPGSYFIQTHNFNNLVDELWQGNECIRRS